MTRFSEQQVRAVYWITLALQLPLWWNMLDWLLLDGGRIIGPFLNAALLSGTIALNLTAVATNKYYKRLR